MEISFKFPVKIGLHRKMLQKKFTNRQDIVKAWIWCKGYLGLTSRFNMAVKRFFAWVGLLVGKTSSKEIVYNSFNGYVGGFCNQFVNSDWCIYFHMRILNSPTTDFLTNVTVWSKFCHFILIVFSYSYTASYPNLLMIVFFRHVQSVAGSQLYLFLN